MGMKRTRKRRKNIQIGSHRVQTSRLVILVACLVCLLTGIGYGGYQGCEYIHRKLGHRKAVQLEDGTEIPFVKLETLRDEIQDVLCIKNLKHLRTDIQTYMFNNQLNDLKDQIGSYLKEHNVDESKIAWAVQDLSTGAYTESDNANENFTAASTYKLPLAMLWYEKVQEGSASMTDTFSLTERMLEKEDNENPDQPIGRKYRLGDRIPLSELLEGAALYSDNIAGHILFENLGGYSAYKVAALKYSDTLQAKEFTGTDNVLNPHYTMNLMNYLYNHPGTFDDLKYWLYAAFPYSFLNHNAPYGYVQKVGNIEEVRNAVGLMPGEFPYSVSVYSCIDSKEGEAIIGDIGTICYNYFQNKYNSGFYDSSSTEEKQEKSNMNVQESALAPYAVSGWSGGSVYDAFQNKDKKNQDGNQSQQSDPAIEQTGDQQNAAGETPEAPAENTADEQTDPQGAENTGDQNQ